MKKVVFIIIIVLIIGSIGFGGYLFTKNIKEDKKLTNEMMQKLIKEYNKFDKSIGDFASKREEFYVMQEDAYLESISQNVETWNNFVSDYSKSIVNIKKNSKLLDKYCFNKFASIEVNNSCTKFIANYEAAMNYYISDIKSYNKNIVEKYNSWISENNYDYQKLENGKLSAYKDYIDYDKDNEFFGKEEENE